MLIDRHHENHVTKLPGLHGTLVPSEQPESGGSNALKYAHAQQLCYFHNVP